MLRDFELFKKWEEWNRIEQEKDFELKKAKAIEDAQKQQPYNEWFVEKARKMKFQFDRKYLIHYGECQKFEKKVSFIPEICQPKTQHCFVHRKDAV